MAALCERLAVAPQEKPSARAADWVTDSSIARSEETWKSGVGRRETRTFDVFGGDLEVQRVGRALQHRRGELGQVDYPAHIADDGSAIQEDRGASRRDPLERDARSTAPVFRSRGHHRDTRRLAQQLGRVPGRRAANRLLVHQPHGEGGLGNQAGFAGGGDHHRFLYAGEPGFGAVSVSTLFVSAVSVLFLFAVSVSTVSALFLPVVSLFLSTVSSVVLLVSGVVFRLVVRVLDVVRACSGRETEDYQGE